MKRRYQKLSALMLEIKKMLAEGKTQKEIQAYFGLAGERPIHDALKRERQKAKKSAISKTRGRKAAVTLEEYKYENKRLAKENELLRSFLRAAGRM